jgi:DNA-binding transcriptional LysR family regulator
MGIICYESIQMADPIETAEMLAFTRTVDAKSLSRAAIELRAPRATISRRLARLEERLGVRLLRRTTRSIALTDAGEAFYRHARLVLEAVEQAEASVHRDPEDIRGPLRVSLPPMIEPDLYATLAEFAKKHPGVNLQAHFTARYVDLQREGYDVALRASMSLEPGLVARTLSRMPVIAVASPAYLAEHPAPRNARELRRHRLLVGFARGELPATQWPLLTGGKVAVEGAFASSDPLLLVDGARRGLGIALGPMFVAARMIEKRELVHVLPGVLGAESRLSIVQPERELVLPQVRAFVEVIVRWAKTSLREMLETEPSKRKNRC